MTTTTPHTTPDSAGTRQRERKPRFPNTFLEVLLEESDAPYPFGDVAQTERHVQLLEEVKGRVGNSTDEHNRVPGPFIIENAAARYFALLDHGRRSMEGMFTEVEFVTMLNTTCCSLWEWNPWMSVATMVADDNGIDSWDEVPEGSSLDGFLQKLVALSPVQNAALVDVCERVWRDRSDRSLAEKLDSAGLPPASDR